MCVCVCVCVCVVGCFNNIWISETPWTAACQAPLPMGCSRQGYWSGLAILPPGDVPDWGIEPAFPAPPASQTNSLPRSHRGSPEWCVDTVYWLLEWHWCCAFVWEKNLQTSDTNFLQGAEMGSLVQQTLAGHSFSFLFHVNTTHEETHRCMT